jgi:hypothetical protein
MFCLELITLIQILTFSWFFLNYSMEQSFPYEDISLSTSKKFSVFMESQDVFSCPQNPTIGTYSESDESNPYHSYKPL